MQQIPVDLNKEEIGILVTAAELLIRHTMGEKKEPLDILFLKLDRLRGLRDVLKDTLTGMAL